jgi:hypothetical protein
MLAAVGGWLLCASGGSRFVIAWHARWMVAGVRGALAGQSGKPVSGLMTGSGKPGMP